MEDEILNANVATLSEMQSLAKKQQKILDSSSNQSFSEPTDPMVAFKATKKFSSITRYRDMDDQEVGDNPCAINEVSLLV